MPKTLLDIPDEVVQGNILPLLKINELLRLRRVSKFTRDLTDDYLRVHPRRSRIKTRINLTALMKDDEEDLFSLESFLHEDASVSSIIKRIPTSGFNLCWHKKVKSTEAVFQDSLTSEFLEKYGSNVVHLKVFNMTIPLGENEFNFYSNLPNLRCLSVLAVEVEVDRMDHIHFPESFRNLKKLKIKVAIEYRETQSLLLLESPDSSQFQWKLLEFCRNLETYVAPFNTDLSVLNKILTEKIHHKLQFYDMKEGPKFNFTEYEQVYRNLCEMLPVSNIKWANVPSDLLSSFDKICLERVASQVVSLKDIKSYHDFKGVVFPNVDALRLYWVWEDADTDDDQSLRKFAELPVIFPNLKRLQIRTPLEGAGGKRLLWMLWRLPNLEEITFNDCVFGDAAFIGEDEVPPFLQLRKLKKLDLGKLRLTGGLTDATFLHVFRNMRLRELRMASAQPLAFITSAGIRALLTGPFRETIENFPFSSWSLAGLNQEEFRQLAAEFPNNQSL